MYRALAEPQVVVQLTRRRRLGMILKVIELRLRFIVLVAATGLVFASWDTLVNQVEKWSRPGEGHHPSSSSQTDVELFCPMHPSVVSEQGGQCPICGMQLARRMRAGIEILTAGVLSRVRLEPRQIARAGIRTAAVDFAPAIDRLTTSGLIGIDDSRRVQVASEGRGRARIERIHVHSEGEHVRAGQRLAELYSYDVAQSIRALLEASSAMHAPPATRPDPNATPLGDPGERFRLATQSLQVLGVHQDQIDAIAADNCPDGLLPLLAPIGGVVIKKTAYSGQYVPEGMLLFEIADLGHVWVDAQVFEDQLALVRIGQPVTATVTAFPGEEFRGHVEQLAPALDPATHTLAVRFGLDNPGVRLRPGMLTIVAVNVAHGLTPVARGATCPVTGLRLGTMGPVISVEVQGRTVSVCCKACAPKLMSAPEKYLDLGPRDTSTPDRVISVPGSAVVDTGTKTIVYVEASPGVFEGRAVVLGPRSGDSFPVLDGLVPGERVAAAGAFLIDAESRLNPATRADAAYCPALPAPEATPPVQPTLNQDPFLRNPGRDFPRGRGPERF
jgi:membrane fusion protein, copper/silver efflux system